MLDAAIALAVRAARVPPDCAAVSAIGLAGRLPAAPAEHAGLDANYRPYNPVGCCPFSQNLWRLNSGT